jgi:phospholipid/cholesterol/gamma-HCH transport system permease protein
MAEQQAYFSVEQTDEQTILVTLKGSITVAHASLLQGLWSALGKINAGCFVVNIADVAEYDSLLAVVIARLQQRSGNTKITIQGLTPPIERFLQLYSFTEETTQQQKFSFADSIIRTVERGGATVINLLYALLSFLGEITIGIALAFLRPSRVRWADVPFLFRRAGVDGFAIVTLIGGLIGVIIGYQGALQLKKFGGDMFLAQLVNISITRELGPLMTAIIVAGRSGASFAAELGTMKVGEEIDALTSMGLRPVRFLVIPRILATIIAIPLLTFFADIAGMIGGMVTGVATLDLTYTGYLLETQRSLGLQDLFLGLGKSIFFGIIIASVGCYKGMQAQGGAESVGLYTTSAVVLSIFLIIASDAVFAFILQVFGI